MAVGVASAQGQLSMPLPLSGGAPGSAPSGAESYPVAPQGTIDPSGDLSVGPAARLVRSLGSWLGSPVRPVPGLPTLAAAPAAAVVVAEPSMAAAPSTVALASGGRPSSAASAGPLVAPEVAGYRLAGGDLVRITVYQNPDLSLETRLNDTGTLSYPLVGVLQLGGLGIAAAERRVADALRQGQFVRQPQVAITVLEVRGHQASVLGQVNRPGRYPLEVTALRLSDLLALAGGTAPGGADRVVVSGLRDGQPFRAEVDLPSLFGPEGRDRDFVIRHGDTVWVDRQPQFYIYGEVQRPGVLRLERGMTLMQALATGGGLTARGTDKGIRIHRRSADGRVMVLRPGMHEPVREGDVVHVAESLF